jgi:hypothetical protein
MTREQACTELGNGDFEEITDQLGMENKKLQEIGATMKPIITPNDDEEE